MAQIVSNSEVTRLKGMMEHWAYNGLDCCVTREVADVLGPRLRGDTDRTYNFEMATQAPAMAMMRRGVRVNAGAISAALGELEKDEIASHAKVNGLIPPGMWDRTEKVAGKCDDGKNHKWGPKDAAEEAKACEKCQQVRFAPAAFNPLSSQQGSLLFHDKLGLPRLTNKKGNVSVDDDTLQRLAAKAPEYEPLIDEVLEARGIRKQMGVLASPLSADGRMRSSFNVGAPETGRWSSSANHYREGTNLQNIAEKLRFIFEADPGMELVYRDLSQAESNCVAHLAEDENYIAAHLAGDVHTYVTRYLWPDLPWTGDLKRDRVIAEQPAPFDPDHSFRYNSKRIQHGSNYGLTPFGIARIAKIPLKAAIAAQENYFTSFPNIPAWQKSVVRELTETHVITTPLGRRRVFFGRHWDEHVQRQAIAFVPQSMVADILNVALWRVWDEMDTQVGRAAPSVRDPNRTWLLAQVHDAILSEVRKGDDEAVERMGELMRVPVEIKGRIMVIPSDVARGNNWGKRSEKNPLGMK